MKLNTNESTTVREFASDVCPVSEEFLYLLRQEYSRYPKPHVWAVAVMTQAFRIPKHIAIEVLTEQRACRVQDQKFFIQMAG